MLLEQLRAMLKGKRSKSYYAEKLGISVEEVEEMIEEIKSGTKPLDGNSQKENLDTGTLEVETYYPQPVSTERLIRDNKIDTSEYRLSQLYSKQKSKGWQYTALFTKLKPIEKSLENFMEFLDGWKPEYKPLEVVPNKGVFDEPVCLVLSICDFHLGKLDRSPISTEKRLEAYKETVSNLIQNTYLHYNIEEIVFVVGNDFYQLDTIMGTTVKGTHVDSSLTWDNSYEIGFKLLSEVISQMKSYCKTLRIISVGGNHSESREYYLSHALSIYFRDNEDIIFDRTSDKYKAHTYGKTALFFNHGDNVTERLPLMFAQTFPEQWGQTQFKEIILGHTHKNKERRFTSQDETQGVRMRVIPSLSGTDQWHYDNLFTNNIQAGIGLIYGKVSGKCAEFEHRI